MEFRQNDGGRHAAGFKGEAGDCVARALAIANDQDYRVVYNELAHLHQQMGGRRSARDGLPRKVYRRWLAEQGWEWVPTMKVGEPRERNYRFEDLPVVGRFVVALSKHLTAVVDGVVYDTHDPQRDGTRTIYGYWRVPPALTLGPSIYELARCSPDFQGTAVELAERVARYGGGHISPQQAQQLADQWWARVRAARSHPVHTLVTRPAP